MKYWYIEDSNGSCHSPYPFGRRFLVRANALDALEAYVRKETAARTEWYWGIGNKNAFLSTHCGHVANQVRLTPGTTPIVERLEDAGVMLVRMSLEYRVVDQWTEQESVEVDGQRFSRPVDRERVIQDWGPVPQERAVEWGRKEPFPTQYRYMVSSEIMTFADDPAGEGEV